MIVPPDAPPVPGVAGGSGPLPPPRAPARPSPAWPPGPLRTATRMSVIFKSDGIEFRLTFWGYASRSAKRPSPAAAAPMPRNLRRPIAFFFVDITLPFATKIDSRLEAVNSIRTYLYELKFRSRCSPARRFIPSTNTTSPARFTMVFASGVGLCPGQPQLRGKRRFERPRRGRDDQGRAARVRNGGTVGRLRRLGQGEARGTSPPCKLSSLAES